MTNRPKRRWRLRSLLGAIFALLAWISFPWFHDERLIWSIRRPLATRSETDTPAIICCDPDGRWVVLKYILKDDAEIACTILRQNDGKEMFHSIRTDQNEDKHIPVHADINSSGELIYLTEISQPRGMAASPLLKGSSNQIPSQWLRWCVVKAWNLMMAIVPKECA
jgi:hypothetical protein